MPDEDEDDLGGIEPRSTIDGLRERSFRQRERIKDLRRELDAAKAVATKLQADHGSLQAKHTAAKADHAAALEAATATHAGALQRMERSAALTAAGIDAAGHDVVLGAYGTLGDDAPTMAEWLKGEDLPPHVTCYLPTEQKKATHNPDAGATGRSSAAPAMGDGWLAGATLDDIRALKAAGKL